jgi:hypothetical protein
MPLYRGFPFADFRKNVPARKTNPHPAPVIGFDFVFVD